MIILTAKDYSSLRRQCDVLNLHNAIGTYKRKNGLIIFRVIGEKR